MNRKKLKRLRQRRGLTQRLLARRLRCTRSHVANLENGYRRLTQDWQDKIAKELR